MKNIVVPGEKIDGKIDSYVFRDGNNAYSMVLGVLDDRDDYVKISPLSGKYLPQMDDYVVGVITSVKHGGYVVDINSPYDAFLASRRDYREGDVIFAKVNNVNEVKSVSLSYEKRLYEGDLIEISPVKVPRVIGKKNSMVDQIKLKTSTEIFVGRNGRIWLKGGDVVKAQNAILKIEREAHTDGLTDRITEFLNK
jgi:exosome complex component RRP4